MTENNDADGLAVPAWTVADRMRKSLDASGLGVSEIAGELGVTRGAVGKWINGHVTPRRPTLLAWAAVTRVPMAWLELGEGEASSPAERARGAGLTATESVVPAPLTFLPAAAVSAFG